jgi:hypothetical protein
MRRNNLEKNYYAKRKPNTGKEKTIFFAALKNLREEILSIEKVLLDITLFGNVVQQSLKS